MYMHIYIYVRLYALYPFRINMFHIDCDYMCVEFVDVYVERYAVLSVI